MSATAHPTAVIRKDPDGLRVPPNLRDYARERGEFSWDAARSALDGLPGGRGLNIAHEAVDRHAAGPRRDRVALRFVRRDGSVTTTTYGALAEQTSRFASALAALGVERGDRVFSLLGRVPELYVAALGTLKRGAVYSPLFSAFGPEPVRQRMALGEARVLVTTPALYAKRVAPIRDQLPHLEHILLVGDDETPGVAGAQRFGELVEQAAAAWEIPPTSPEDPALLHFTSGTTGRPKGALHVHDAVVAHHATGRLALDLHDDDVFWCTADPGWVTGTSYGIIAPLSHGVTCVVDEGEFDARRWYATLAEQQVSVWYTAPTAIRMLMRAGDAPAAEHELPALRFVASVGEPLNAEAVVWGQEHLGLPVHDNWWQTETGGIMIANFAAVDVKPGSMGRPIPGIDAAVALRDDEGRVVVGADGEPVMAGDDEDGELVLRAGWPSMFRAYLHDEERYRRAFAGSWYLSGDLVRRDGDGWFWFLGRGDDVIKSAGHLIGPTEIEGALTEHPAVVEAGAIGVPDPVAGQKVKAFVVLHDGHEATDALRRELIGWGRTRLGAAIAPKSIEFRDALPHTRSGKIMRRLLRARELGLPEGDLSTLESGG